MGPAQLMRSLLSYSVVAPLLAGCASTGLLPEEETIPYTERLKTLTIYGLRVSSSVNPRPLRAAQKNDRTNRFDV